MIRINKWLSEMGVCSRKQADHLISTGCVSVNGENAVLGMLISEKDRVSVNGHLIAAKPQPLFLLYNKPVGVVCTHDQSVANNLEDAIDYPQRVFAVGRLDKASEGLLLLTNQGDVVNKIMRAENKHEKVYRVTVDKPVTQAFIHEMEAGVKILNTTTLPCKLNPLASCEFEITLVQGLNRQIRRMCKELGYQVLRLQRVKIMMFDLQGLNPGAIRHLNDKEVVALNKAIEHSTSERRGDT